MASFPDLPTGLHDRFAVLQNRSFAALVAGRSISTFGDGLYGVAVMWLVYELTGSTAYTGLAAFLSQFPNALQALVGPLIDRIDLDRALVAVELVSVVGVVLVPLAALTGNLSVWIVLATIPPLALGNVVAAPAQATAIPRLLDDDDLVRGNGLFRATSTASAALSRGVAGVAVAAVGATALYAANAVTFLVGAVVFRWLTIPDSGGSGAVGGGDDGGSEDTARAAVGGGDDTADRDDDNFDLATYWREFTEGLALLRDSDGGRILVPSLLANFLFGVALAVLPAFADSVGGAATYGFLLAAFTVGGVVGPALAGLFEEVPLWLTGVGGFGVCGLLWLGSVAAPWIAVTAVLFGAAHAAFRVFSVSVRAAFQTAVPEDLLGRAMAAASGATSLVFPLGTLVGGLAGEVVAPRTVMVTGGVGALLAAAVWAIHPTLRGFEPPTAVTPGQFGGSVGE